MIHTIPEIIEYISDVWTLLPGDVILTGTPAGLGPFVAGRPSRSRSRASARSSNPVRSSGVADGTAVAAGLSASARAPVSRAARAGGASAAEGAGSEVDVVLVVPEVERDTGAPGAPRCGDAGCGQRRRGRVPSASGQETIA